MSELLILVLFKFVLAGIVLGAVLNFAGFHTWVERKQSALIQDRIGANRAPIFGFTALGLFHGLADALKMFTKEDIVPDNTDKVLHTMAPFISVFFVLVAFAAIPFGPPLEIPDHGVFALQIAKIDVGILFIFAMLSVGVYGVILAGFASRNNYAIMGGLRATAQMISYEIALGVSIIGVVMVYGTMDLGEIVVRQGETMWGIFLQPVGFLIFVVAALAETKRAPFDLPEAESEIIGYFVEYSGMKFGMFFLTDFLETIMVACLATTLFLGGWQVPFVQPGDLANWQFVILGIASFGFKVVVLCFCFMQVRWTLPRFRYDQLMRLGWKGLFPVALVNVVVTAIVLVLYDWSKS